MSVWWVCGGYVVGVQMTISKYILVYPLCLQV